MLELALAQLTDLPWDSNPIGTRGAQALCARFGNPLAEVLRVASELAQLGQDDPRRSVLETREGRWRDRWLLLLRQRARGVFCLWR